LAASDKRYCAAPTSLVTNGMRVRKATQTSAQLSTVLLWQRLTRNFTTKFRAAKFRKILKQNLSFLFFQIINVFQELRQTLFQELRQKFCKRKKFAKFDESQSRNN
jgi:hypothetical protein